VFFYILVLGQAPKLGNYVQEISPTVTQFNKLIWAAVPATIMIGMLIGIFSSYLAIRKHLKIKVVK
jgi:ABC-type antimicrobial peptide transport system permease subunit